MMTYLNFRESYGVIIPLIACILGFAYFSELTAQDSTRCMPFLKVDRDSPNILWIVPDQPHRDTIGEFGNGNVHSPTRANRPMPICSGTGTGALISWI